MMVYDKELIKISIIVPIYNVETYLKRCILSIINQTYSNIEIILVNDGSKDDSLKICQEFAKEDTRIKVIDKENGGLSDARNAGLLVATGEYVLFVDSDDYIELDSCEKFIDILKDNNVDIITANAKVIKKNMVEFLKHSQYANKNSIDGINYLKNELQNKTMSMAAVLNCYNLDFLRKNNLTFKKGILHEDEEFTPRAFIRADSVFHIDYCFYNYIIRENSISTSKNLTKNAQDLYDTLYELETIYEKEVPTNIGSVFKDSLCTKYLYMAQSIHETKTNFNTDFDKNFIKRNARSKKNKLKAFLFCLNENFYFFMNDNAKNYLKDFRVMFDKKNLLYSLMIILNIIFLSRFFYLYRPENTIINSLYIWISRVIFIFDVGFYGIFIFWQKHKINKLEIFVFGLLSVIFVINIIDKGNIRNLLSSIYPLIGLIIFLDVAFNKNFKNCIIVLFHLFFVLLTVNLVQMFFLNDLIGENVYILGYRNQLGTVLLIAIFISHLYSRYRSNFYFYSILLISLLTTIFGGSMNNLIALTIIFVYILLPQKKLKHFIDNLSAIKVIGVYIVFFGLIVIMHIQNIFSPIIEQVFHRSVSFSGRTYLWDAAITKIIEKPILGYGRSSDTNYFTVDYFNQNGTIRYFSAHNTLIQYFYEFGIIPIILILISLVYFCSIIKRFKLQEMNLFFIILFSMLIIFMMEALPIDGIYILLAVAYFYCLYGQRGVKE